METEDPSAALAKLLQALQERMEITESVLAALIATHPDPGAVLREWQPVAAAATTARTMADISGASLPNPLRKAAHDDQMQHWQNVLLGIVHRARPST